MEELNKRRAATARIIASHSDLLLCNFSSVNNLKVLEELNALIEIYESINNAIFLERCLNQKNI